MFWVCVVVVGISSLRDEQSMNTECVFVELGQKVIYEGVVGAVVLVCSLVDMGKKGLECVVLGVLLRLGRTVVV